MTLQCCDRDKRLQRHAKAIQVNGIESVEVDYLAHFIRCKVYEACDVSTVTVRAIDTETLLPLLLDRPDNCDSASIFSIPMPKGIEEGKTYELSIRSLSDPTEIPDGWDPRLSSALFTYNATANTETDFLHPEPPPTSRFETPAIQYLAKDYAAFRQLILDRMAITMPGWQESHAADLGMTLVELLAFVADRLSYEQDAVATESYLGTARQRSSVRRHARLVDYRMHEGCNARAFVQLQVRGEGSFVPDDLLFTTEFPSGLQLPEGPIPFDRVSDEAWKYVVPFEAMPRVRDDWRLRPEQIKSSQTLRSLFNTKKTDTTCPARQHAGINSSVLLAKLSAEPLWLPEFPPLSVPVSDAARQWIEDVNEWLEEVDILAEATQCQGLYDAIEPLVSQVAHLSVPERNRVVLDAALPEVLSQANLTDRIELFEAHNEIHFYTWDESQCSIEKGATRATLVDYDDRYPAIPRTPCSASPSDKPSCERRLCGLSVGDFLIFEEVVGPLTGNPADADPTKRHVVRITNIHQKSDPVEGDSDQKCDPVNENPNRKRHILEIEWDRRDALPFALCISSKRPPPYCDDVRNVSVARGNVFLADQGRRVERVELGTVQQQSRQVDCGTEWKPPRIETQVLPFQPGIDQPDLCFAQKRVRLGPAAGSLAQDLSQSHPAMQLIAIPSADGVQPIALTPELLASDDGDRLRAQWSRLSEPERIVLETMLRPDEAYELRTLMRQPNGPPGTARSRRERLRQLQQRLLEEATWSSNFDLMEADPDDRQFVVEMDAKRRARLRFGDDEHGQSPAPGTQFFAQMRLGGGAAGNVGANRIARVVIRQNALIAIDGVRNPMPAMGGTDPESIEQAKLLAPHAYLKNQPRALIASDYSRLAQAQFSDRIQSIYGALRHAGTFAWVDVALDPKSDVLEAQQLVRDVQQYLDHVRKIGHLVRVTLQTSVPVDLRLRVKVDPRFPQQAVHGAIVARLSDQPLEDGKLGFFHPDRMTLGQSIHSNAIVHEVMQVSGVITVSVIYFGRIEDKASPPKAGTTADSRQTKWDEFELPLGPLEVATLDRNRKCGGRLTLELEGGR